jgi:hypothetical protein
VSAAYDRKRVALHEAGHVAALALLGHLPRAVTADWPAEGILGFMEHAWGEDDELSPDGVADLVLSIHAGPLAERRSDWPPKWPPRMAEPGDEGQLAACVNYLGWGRPEWEAAFVKAEHLTRSRDFRQVVGLLARALEVHDVLDTDDVCHLIGDERLARFGIDTRTKD